MPFQRGEFAVSKLDARGTVVVRVFLQDDKRTSGFPVPGNRKEEVAVKDSTVGEVFEAINKALFTEEE
jgi:hypothetical protein